MTEKRRISMIPKAPDELGDWITLGDAVEAAIEECACRTGVRRQDGQGRHKETGALYALNNWRSS